MLRSGCLKPLPRLAIVTILATASATLPGRAEADIYSYTDADGVIHFSNKASGGPFKLYMKTADHKQRAKRATAAASVMPSDKSPDRFSRYAEWIRQASALYQIPEALVRAVIKCESDYDPRAISPVGAIGLMQLMPETALRMQVRDPFDPRENIFGGTRYLRVLANTFNGDLSLTIAGYNAGEGSVARYGGIPPYAETQAYVSHVLEYYGRYRATPDVVSASNGN